MHAAVDVKLAAVEARLTAARPIETVAAPPGLPPAPTAGGPAASPVAVSEPPGAARDVRRQPVYPLTAAVGAPKGGASGVSSGADGPIGLVARRWARVRPGRGWRQLASTRQYHRSAGRHASARTGCRPGLGSGRGSERGAGASRRAISRRGCWGPVGAPRLVRCPLPAVPTASTPPAEWFPLECLRWDSQKLGGARLGCGAGGLWGLV